MIHGMFSVYDAAVKAFLPPFFCRTKGEAIRSFSEAANKEDHQFFRHYADYSLFYLGEFDDTSGVYAGVSAPQRIVTAMEVRDDSVLPPLSRTASSGPIT